MMFIATQSGRTARCSTPSIAWRLRLVVGFACVSALLLVGCSSPAEVEPVEKTMPTGLRVDSSEGTYQIIYDFPDPIPVNEPFTFEGQVVGPGSPTAVAVDAAMPHHQHGMVRRPEVKLGDDNRFEVEGMLFHMPGRWEVYFDVTEGPATERAQLEIELD